MLTNSKVSQVHSDLAKDPYWSEEENQSEEEVCEEEEEGEEEEQEAGILATKRGAYTTMLTVLGNRLILVLIVLGLFMWWFYDMFAWWERLDGYWFSAIFIFAAVELLVIHLLIYLSKDQYRYYRESGMALLMRAMAEQQDVMHSQHESLLQLKEEIELLTKTLSIQGEQLDRIEELARVRRRRRGRVYRDPLGSDSLREAGGEGDIRIEVDRSLGRSFDRLAQRYTSSSSSSSHEEDGEEIEMVTGEELSSKMREALGQAFDALAQEHTLPAPLVVERQENRWEEETHIDLTS